MRARLPLLVVTLLAVSAGAAGAVGVTVGTGLLATSSKTLTHATCTLTGASVDTYTAQATPNTAVGNSSTSLQISPTSGAQKKAYIQFDFSTCPSASQLNNAEVDSATLTVFASGTTTRTISVYRVTSSWSGTLTWNTAPTVASSATTTFSSTTGAASSKSIDVTLDVNDFLQSSPTVLPPYSATVPNDGWLLADGGTGSATTTVTSTNSSSNKPVLTINYAY